MSPRGGLRWLALAAMMPAVQACHWPASGKTLTDGCYYTPDDEPIMLIDGGLGTLLVPGAVQHFAVTSANPWSTTFQPGWLLNSEGPGLSVDPAFEDRKAASYRMIPALVPTVEARMTGFGEVLLHRGSPCDGRRSKAAITILKR